VTGRPLPCIACGRELEAAFSASDRAERQPADAVMFYAYGQYGSTVFDPQDESQLQVNVCDPCLLERRDRVWHARYVRQRALEVFSRPWDPARSSDG